MQITLAIDRTAVEFCRGLINDLNLSNLKDVDRTERCSKPETPQHAFHIFPS